MIRTPLIASFLTLATVLDASPASGDAAVTCRRAALELAAACRPSKEACLCLRMRWRMGWAL